MSRKTKRKKKKAVMKAVIQGRTLRTIRKIKILQGGRWGEFVYRNNVYQIEDVLPHANINLETSIVTPVREYEGSVKKSNRKRKKKGKKVKVNYIAKLYSNATECPDVELIYENTES